MLVLLMLITSPLHPALDIHCLDLEVIQVCIGVHTQYVCMQQDTLYVCDGILKGQPYHVRYGKEGETAKNN